MTEEIGHNPLEGDKPLMTIKMTEPPREEKVSIIVVHRDNADYLNICLQSIAVNSSRNNYEIIVVDNGSETPDAVQFINDLDEHGEVKVVKNKKNLWFPAAINQGVRAADEASKYFIFMHYDTVVLSHNWIDLLINVVETSEAGMVGMGENSYKIDSQMVRFLDDWCMLVTRECFEDCGPLEESLPVTGSSFIFTLSCQYGGYKPQQMKNNTVHHYQKNGFSSNDFEKYALEAQAHLPKVLRKLQLKYQSQIV